MGLKLYNTLTRTKQDFVPIDRRNVRMYVCGPTVYDFAHIGNARPLIVFDVLFRLLRHLYGPEHVTYVRNITDIDDKIIARAAEDHPDLPLNEAVKRVTETTEKQFHEDVRTLGCLEPTAEPRATEHIAEMKAMIETLVEKGFAYIREDHVLFEVAKMPDYGRLSNRSLDEMIAGARVEVAPYKKDPMDFVLWKPSKGREPAWPSPAGIATPGRPGWHLECSAMSDRWLWEAAMGTLSEAGLAHPHQFDIHGGGVDLVFPHHENEIAQSRSAHGTPAMANYWLHNGYLQVEGEKMAKSAGNFVTVRELLNQTPADVIRLQMLMTHYRQPIDWTERATLEASQKIEDWLLASLRSKPRDQKAFGDEQLVGALEDDLNTPEGIAYLDSLSHHAKRNAADSLRFANNVIFLGVFRDHKTEVVPLVKQVGARAQQGADLSVLSEINRAEWLRRDKYELENIARVFREKDEYLLHLSPTARWSDAGAFDASLMNGKISARTAARKRKDFAEADRIRDELDAMGITVKDSRNPETGELETTWEVKR